MSLYDDKQEKTTTEYVDHKPAGWLVGVAVLALIIAIIALVWSFTLRSRISDAEAKLVAANQQNAALSGKVDDTNERMNAQTQELAQSMGLTQKQLEEKSDQLVAAQRLERVQTAHLTQAQRATEQKVGAVQTDVAAVKTDVGGVKTDVANTQADLNTTKTQLTRVMGDAGVMSGLIATNHTELEELKHKGDRNYYEFTLHKGAKAENVGTIKLELKKINLKRSKYTLIVSSDDRNIEKKDRTVDEPVQFYSGKTPALFEIVVNGMSKNTVTGYLSTPKSAPEPIAVP